MNGEWKIYTRQGDKGETSLIGGRRVPKYDLQIEAYGTIDELNAFIGQLYEQPVMDLQSRHMLLEIMDRLFTAESLLAEDKSPDPDGTRKKKALPGLDEADVTLLEKEIDRMNEHLPELTAFILPGGSQSAAAAHVARCVCRRAERIVLQLSLHLPFDPLIIKYLNRLSDYLFVLARHCTYRDGGEEIRWQARV